MCQKDGDRNPRPPREVPEEVRKTGPADLFQLGIVTALILFSIVIVVVGIYQSGHKAQAATVTPAHAEEAVILAGAVVLCRDHAEYLVMTSGVRGAAPSAVASITPHYVGGRVGVAHVPSC